MTATPTIIEACWNLFGVELSPAQETLLRAIYGLPLTEEQRGIFLAATGRAEYEPRVYRDVSVIAGRRSGKSSRVVAPAVLYEAAVVPHDLPAGERGMVLVVAPVQQQARITFGMVLAKLESSPVLSRLLANVRTGVNESQIELTNRIDIRVVAANFRHIRGALGVAAFFEEGAFFRDETGANPFSDLIASVRPSLVTVRDSKLFRVSSPWGKTGVMWDDFRLRAERPETLCWRLPSWEMNPGIPAAELERERERDQDYFAREFGAEFADAASALLPADAVEAAVARADSRFPPEAGRRYVAALDAGFKSDAFAFAVASRNGDGIRVDLARHWKPAGPRKPVRFDVVMQEIMDLARHYRISRIAGDRVCAQPIREALERAGIRFDEVTTLGRRAAPIYATLRAKLMAGHLVLPNSPELIAQLKRLELVVGAGGAERVEATSGHDDLAVATATAVSMAAEQRVARLWISRISSESAISDRGWERV